MNSKILGLLALSLLAGPMSAGATQVSWLLRGSLETVEGAQFAGVAPGQTFKVVLHFDSEQALSGANGGCQADGTGTCRHNSAPVATQYFSDIRLGNSFFPDFFSSFDFDNLLIARNNATDLVAEGVVDGYSFRSRTENPGGEFTNFQAIFRGSNDLSVVTNARVLPSSPPPGLLGLTQHIFEVCDADATGACSYGFVRGIFNSVSRVPEPGTLALLGLGLAVLGLSRRRRVA